MPFKINSNDITYATTTRGVNAYAPIRDASGLEVGRIDDKAEAIVATVHFESLVHRTEFASEAVKWAATNITGYNKHSIDYHVSEYARALLEDAENELLNKGS
jgi:hypothetical protein